MLVTITNQCQMGCSHCLEDAQPVGQHMTLETYKKALSFIERTYRSIKIIMISGGEPTEHPQLFEFLDLLGPEWHTILMSNGLFLKDEKIKNKVFSYKNLAIQIYNDPRYYPVTVEDPKHPRIVYGNRINLMSPFGRAVKNGIKSERSAPVCFNLRSCARTTKNFSEAVLALRMNGKMCTPSIKITGDIIAGEAPTCYKIGTVESSEDDLLKNLLSMSCNKCGLENNLSAPLKKYIQGNLL